jgi:hypothetical protein
MTLFGIIVSRWVPLVEEDCLTFNSTRVHPYVFSKVRITQSYVFYVVFCEPFIAFFIWTYTILRFTTSDLRIFLA